MRRLATLFFSLVVVLQTVASRAENSFSTDVYLSHHPSRPPRKDSVETFLNDLAQLSSLPDVDLVTDTHSKRDSSYTKSWTAAEWKLHQRDAFFRYRHHLRTWFQSPTALAVLPAVGACTAWAAVVLLLASQFDHVVLTHVSTAAFNAPIALLLTLRTNRSLDRLFEARNQWGITMRAVTSLAGMANVYFDSDDTAATEKSCSSLLMGRYLVLYAWSLKGLFRGEDDRAVVQHLLPEPEATWLLNAAADRPTAIIFRLRRLIQQQMMVKQQKSNASQQQHWIMEERLCDLEMALGTCKRILGSPIPPTYTRHLSRVLVLYLFLLPFGFVGNVSPVAVLLNVALTAYITIGLDEISVEIEHPFPLLPLFHLSKALQQNVANQYSMNESSLSL